MIELCGLLKSFGFKQVLDGIDLMLVQGESFVIIGGLGIGKFVLLCCILGFEIVDVGQILWQGQLLMLQCDVFMQGFGMLFQNVVLFDSLFIWCNVVFCLLCMMFKVQVCEVVIVKLVCVGFGFEVVDLFFVVLLGGMCKCVGLVWVIVVDLCVIFFDELMMGLDLICVVVINVLICEIVDEIGVMVIMIIYDMILVWVIGDWVVLLDWGCICWQGMVVVMDSVLDVYLQDFIVGWVCGLYVVG